MSYDHLGSVRLVTDQGGNVVGRHDYALFGQPAPPGSVGRTASVFGLSTDVGTRFTGQIRDTETGNDFFNARYFASGLGSFMSPDPGNAGADIMNPQSWNGYAYVLGNPLGLTDPSGLDPQCGPGRYFTGEGCSGNPSDLSQGENNYVNVTVIPGYMSGVNSHYPEPVYTHFPSCMTSATIFFGNDTAQQIGTLSANSVAGADPLGGEFAGALSLVGQNIDAQYAFLGKFAGSSVAAGAGVAAGLQLAALPTMQVIMGPGEPFHVAFAVNGTWLHASAKLGL